VTITPGESPRLANSAERIVYQTLLEQFQPNILVIPAQRITDHLEDHGDDFVGVEGGFGAGGPAASHECFFAG
jgi:hypothetical protein